MRIPCWLTLSLFAACASGEQERIAAQGQRTHERASQQLKVGMTKAEVAEAFPNGLDCKGSAKSYEKCSAKILVGAALYSPMPSNPGNPTDKYQHYELDFENGQLRRWKNESENSLR